eukprot:GFYU01003371.1.p1 GENE.GFYU01003371.1~~GFYU01003371.1.p1  ORF type:complete len:478 (-),score=133.26 GFYU01003371.1:108-1541(-)
MSKDKAKPTKISKHSESKTTATKVKAKTSDKDIVAAATSSPAPTDLTTFASLGLCDQLVEACNQLGWKTPTEIQQQSVPWALKGRDIIGLAETGSGKTGAFALPIIESLLKKPQALFALVLSPTRELSYQIYETFEALGSGIGLKCCCVVGGLDMMSQAVALAQRPHVVIATPGRLVDHLENTKGFNLKSIKYLILDEADRLLNLEFEKEINQILKLLPKERNSFLFSATMTSKVQKLQRASLSDPVKVEVSSKYQTVKTLVQQYVFIPAKHKDCYLAFILNELAGNSTIIFTSTCAATQRVALMLRNLGFSAIPIHGQMTQPKRLGALNKFKSGSRQILLATDVASRGLDMPCVDVVINYDVPTNSKDYIHRVGRTARAGRSGRALTLVTQYDVELFQRIEYLIGHKMDLYSSEESEVLLLLERVGEAHRMAIMEMKETNNGRKHAREEDDDDDDAGSQRARKRQHNMSKKNTKKR